MKRAILGILVAVALGFVLSGCPKDCPEYLGHDDPLVGTTGDSILKDSGCLCGGGDLYVSQALLNRGLEDYQVVSFAVGGTKITGEIPQQYENLKTTYPNVDIVLVNGGANDLSRAEMRGMLDEDMIQGIAQEMSDYLTMIYSDARKAVVYTIPYLLAPPPTATREGMENINDAIYELNTAYITQADGLGFPVYALDAMMEESPEEYYADWIHPTCAAQKEMGERVAVMIDDLLQSSAVESI